MSIQSEINRITSSRDSAFTEVASKGVTVPSGSTIDDLPGLIRQIQTGSGGGGLEYDAGTFTLASNYGGGTGTYNVPHNLGEVPGLTLVWTNYFDDDSHTPDRSTSIGFIFLQGLMSLPQKISGSGTNTGFYANLYMASGEKKIQISVPTSTSYASFSSTAENIRLNKKMQGTSYYWIGGITYNYIVIKKWW